MQRQILFFLHRLAIGLVAFPFSVLTSHRQSDWGGVCRHVALSMICRQPKSQRPSFNGSKVIKVLNPVTLAVWHALIWARIEGEGFSAQD